MSENVSVNRATQIAIIDIAMPVKSLFGLPIAFKVDGIPPPLSLFGDTWTS
jgi:hypothetical protein